MLMPLANQQTFKFVELGLTVHKQAKFQIAHLIRTGTEKQRASEISNAYNTVVTNQTDLM